MGKEVWPLWRCDKLNVFITRTYSVVTNNIKKMLKFHIVILVH